MIKSIFDYFKILSSGKWVKGLELSVMSAIGTGVYNAMQSGHVPTTMAEFQPILLVGLTAGVGYIIHPTSVPAPEVSPVADSK